MITITIVDENPDMLQAIKRSILRDKELFCINTHYTVKEAIENIPLDKPDIVLLDIKLNGESGIDIIRTIKKTNPEMLFMVCTRYDDKTHIHEALKAGARGYVLKRVTKKQLRESIKELYFGGSPISPEIRRHVVDFFSQNDDIWDSLSERQKEIFECAKLLTNKETALKLGIPLGTIKNHITAIYKKLVVKNMAEATDLYNKRKK